MLSCPQVHKTSFSQPLWGLYIHIPFCRKKCIYCDFFSGGISVADWKLFTSGIIREMELRKDECLTPLRTVYIGGGTPSLLPPDALIRIIEAIHELFNCSEILEFSFEVNPEDVNYENVKLWKNVGINRISLGIQSLDDSELTFLKRNHDSSRALDALQLISSEFKNVSVDIIFGIPGQSQQSLLSTINKILNFRPSHLSVYSLMYEEGTALTKLRDIGKFEEVDDTYALELYKIASQTLLQNGYEHYEISNYALPGHRSIHNTSYWEFYPYIGIGPSAHSYDGETIRRGNVLDIKPYMDSAADFPHTLEHLSTEEQLEEYVMLRLRTRDGLSFSDFKDRFDSYSLSSLLKNCQRFLDNKQLKIGENSISLTEKGIMQLDHIILNIL